jgi:hypothetical protein
MYAVEILAKSQKSPFKQFMRATPRANLNFTLMQYYALAPAG